MSAIRCSYLPLYSLMAYLHRLQPQIRGVTSTASRAEHKSEAIRILSDS